MARVLKYNQISTELGFHAVNHGNRFASFIRILRTFFAAWPVESLAGFWEGGSVLLRLAFVFFCGYRAAVSQGGGLGGAYIAWLAGLALLYPVCGWLGGLKARKAANSVWRLF
jgi:hypothetical protein